MQQFDREHALCEHVHRASAESEEGRGTGSDLPCSTGGMGRRRSCPHHARCKPRRQKTWMGWGWGDKSQDAQLRGQPTLSGSYTQPHTAGQTALRKYGPPQRCCSADRKPQPCTTSTDVTFSWTSSVKVRRKVSKCTPRKARVSCCEKFEAS